MGDWLDTTGLSESLRLFRQTTFTPRAKTKKYGLTIDLLQEATKELWACYGQLIEQAEQKVDEDQLNYFQAGGYTVLALHELYRREYVPFARSGSEGWDSLAHFKDGLKPLDELQSLLPKLGGLESYFGGQLLAYRLEWLTRPRQFGMEQDGWEAQYDSERTEYEKEVDQLRTNMLSPIEVAIVFLGSRQWEQAIQFCRDEEYCDETVAEAHTMIGEILAAGSDYAPRTRETFDEAICELRQGLDCRMHTRLHYAIAFLHALYVRPEVFGFPREWIDHAADQELWVKADELIAGMPCSARVQFANSYGLAEALAGIHEQFPGMTVDREKCLHYAECTIKEVSSSSSRKEVECFGPLAHYWIGYVHDVLTPDDEKNTTIFIKTCEGYVAYVEQMLQHGNRWDPSYIARVYSLLHLPKQHGFIDVTDEVRVPFVKQLDDLCQSDAARPLQADELEFRRFSFIWSQLSRFCIEVDLHDPVLAARQQELFESGLTTATTHAAVSQHHHFAGCPQASADVQAVQADAISRIQADKDETIQAARRLDQIKSDKALKGFYIGFMREMNARFVASQALSTGMIEKNVGDVCVTIASNVLSLIPVFGSAAQSIFNTVTTAVLEKKMNKYVNNVCKIAINAKQMDALVQDIALAVLTQPGMSERLNQLNKDQKNNTKWFQRLVKFASDTADKIDELFGVFAEKHETEYQEMGALEGVRLLTVVSEGELFTEKDAQGKQVKVVFSELSNEEQVGRLQRIVRDKLMAIQVVAPTTASITPVASVHPSLSASPSSDSSPATITPNATSPQSAIAPFTSSNSSSPPSASSVEPGHGKSVRDWNFHVAAMPDLIGLKTKFVTWRFIWRQRAHTVELHHSPWGGRKLIADNRVRLQKRGIGAARYDLSVGEGESTCSICVQIKPDGSYDLLIGNEPFAEAKKFWLDRADA